MLNERYTIQSVLGEVGPFDVHYLAWDLKDEKEVVLREYYPVRLAKRAHDGMSMEVHDADLFEYGLGAYSAEGLVLNKLTHKYIAGCQDPFKQNGTVYCVYNFISGAPLGAYLKQQGGKLSEEDALPIIEKVLQALEASHTRKLYHGAVSPKTILIDNNGNPILLGFQAARFKLARECEDLKDILKPGYSAPEQIAYEAEEGPWWDIYGCAATLFHMLTGQDLPEAKDGWSSNKIKVALYRDGLLSAEMCDVLAVALSFATTDRPADIEAFREMLLKTQRVTRQLHEGDGVPQYEVGYTAEISPQEAVWQNGTEVTAAKITIETDVPPVVAPAVEEQERVDSEMPNVVPSNPPQMLQTTNAPDIAPNDAQQSDLQLHEQQLHEPHLLEQQQAEQSSQRSSGREQELEVLLTKMVKWQQVFVAFILAIVVIALLGLVGGVFFGTDLFQRSANQPAEVADGAAPPQSTGPASAQAAVSPQGDTPELSGDPASNASLSTDISEETQSREAVEESVEAAAQNGASSQARAEDVSRTENNAIVDDPEPEVLQAEESSPEQPDNIPAETVVANQETSEQADESANEGVFFTDEDLGLSIEEPDSIASLTADETVKIDEQERLFNYYRVQGDSLMNQGFTVAALQWYQNAKKYNDDDLYVNEQISVITESISTEERNAKAEDSLATRLLQVRDESGIFTTPDTPVVIVDEDGLRAKIKYPISAVNGRVSGRVILRYMVDEEGQIQDIKVVRGPGWGTEDVVIELLRKAAYQPATFNGEAVKAWATFTTVFQL